MQKWRRYTAWLLWLGLVLVLHAWMGLELSDTLEQWRHTPPDAIAPAEVRVVELLKPAAPSMPATRSLPTAAVSAPQAPALSLPDPPLALASEPALASDSHHEQSTEMPVASELAKMAAKTATLQGPSADVEKPLPVSAEDVWPPSFRIQYKLEGNYKGHFTGQAYIVWLRDADRYRVELDVQVGALLSHHLMSEGRLSMTGLIPERFAENRRLLFQRKKQQLRFEPSPEAPQSIAVLLPDGTRRTPTVGVQDPASQFVQLAWLFATQPNRLEQGNRLSFPLASFKRSDIWTYQMGETVMVQTPLGEVAAIHAKPQREVEPMSGNLQVELWFAPSLRFLPVRMRVQDAQGGQADMMIEGLPQLLGAVKLHAHHEPKASDLTATQSQFIKE